MSSQPKSTGRALTGLMVAALYFFLARALAQHGAHGLVSDDWNPLVEQAMFAFLLLIGYACFGFVINRQANPIREQGLPLRRGWLTEAGMGVAFGWGIALACVLPLAVFGGIALRFTVSAASLGWLLADVGYFVLATLAVQLAFRGYPFLCTIRLIGDLPAALVMAVLYGILRATLPGASGASMAVSVALGLLLAMAYLRTRALWLAWGLHFGWVATRALLFGLTVSGVGSHSPVVQGEPVGSYQLAGADFGLDGSWLAFFLLLAAMPFLYRATRELSFVHNAPVLEPGGLAVNLDAAARSQHEAATRPDVPEVKPLVQILPAGAPVLSPYLPVPAAPTDKTGDESPDLQR